MLFNGKYYNKPGHLGMTTEELKEALAGGGSGYPNIDILYGKINGGTATISKSFSEILASIENNSVILILQDSDRTLMCNLIQADGNHISFTYRNSQLDVNDQIVIFSTIVVEIASDDTVTLQVDGPYKVSVTPYTP